MSSNGKSSQIPPHPPWATLTSTTVAIPMPASAAINGGAARPAGGRRVLEEKLPQLTPGPRGQRPPGSLFELPRRQPSHLEVLA